ncbi:MAG: hypothetical protein L3J09_07875 [Flavobacteriaceae bacterium]|nr:hypothetical protein [Flavobacteriaceae bacterium]
MKHKMNKFILFTFIITTLFSCSKPLEYKFLDKDKLATNCNEIDVNLVHEVYYSFREDIANYAEKNKQTENLKYQHSLALYIVNGVSGQANYKNIVSKHTKNIVKILAKENQLWNKDKSLNYKSTYINCLIDNIKNNEVKNAILFYRDDKLSKNELVEIYRLNIRDVKTDDHFAMFIAFESYYQFLNKLEY